MHFEPIKKLIKTENKFVFWIKIFRTDSNHEKLMTRIAQKFVFSFQVLYQCNNNAANFSIQNTESIRPRSCTHILHSIGKVCRHHLYMSVTSRLFASQQLNLHFQKSDCYSPAVAFPVDLAKLRCSLRFKELNICGSVHHA